MTLASTLRFVLDHPLNRAHRVRALARFVRWQLGASVSARARAVPYVDDTVLMVEPGMTGATGNVYCGLHEFEDMGFALHFLRAGDRFVDVGANVGSYTILACAAGADCIAFEPVPETIAKLQRNIAANGLQSRVRIVDAAAGAIDGDAPMTIDRGPMNRVVAVDGQDGRTARVRVATLDTVLTEVAPTVIKVDVEGNQDSVLIGAARTLEEASTLALIVEGGSEAATASRLSDSGFTRVWYDPVTRNLGQNPRECPSGNALFVRDVADAARRCSTARRFALTGIGQDI